MDESQIHWLLLDPSLPAARTLDACTTIAGNVRALVIKPEPMKLTLDHPKSWEIRHGRSLIKELIGFIESGQAGRRCGKADISLSRTKQAGIC
jgi:hypothetical protein